MKIEMLFNLFFVRILCVLEWKTCLLGTKVTIPEHTSIDCVAEEILSFGMEPSVLICATGHMMQSCWRKG